MSVYDDCAGRIPSIERGARSFHVLKRIGKPHVESNRLALLNRVPGRKYGFGNSGECKLADIEAVLQAIKTLQQTLEPLSPKARELALDNLFRVLGIMAPVPVPVPERAAQPAHTAPHLPLQSSTCLQPIAHILVGNLVMLAKAYAELVDIKLTTVGTNSTKTAKFYVDLEKGKTSSGREVSCTLRKYDILTEWFLAHWPEGSEMPTLQDPKHYPGNSEVKMSPKKAHSTKAPKAEKKAGQKRAAPVQGA